MEKKVVFFTFMSLGLNKSMGNSIDKMGNSLEKRGITPKEITKAVNKRRSSLLEVTKAFTKARLLRRKSVNIT